MEDGKVNKCTIFEVVSTHLWRAISLALEMSSDEISTVLFLMKFKTRMEPPFPTEYAGNVVVQGYVRARVKELRDRPFSSFITSIFLYFFNREGINKKYGSRMYLYEHLSSLFGQLEVSCSLPSGGIQHSTLLESTIHHNANTLMTNVDPSIMKTPHY